MTRGISQTPEMVRWCARTSAYRVVGAPERRLARIGAVVAGNPAHVIKQVAELTCPPGWFERPYLWPPYAETEPFDPGEACDDVPPRYEPPAPKNDPS